MARKRERPPKTPNTPKTIPINHDISASELSNDVTGEDGLVLDAEDLAEIDNLSPKKALAWIEKLDVLRLKVKERADMNTQSEGVSPDPSPVSSERVLETPNPIAPTEKEIDDVVGALKTKDAIEKETIPPENVARAKEEAIAVLADAVRDNKDKEIESPASAKQKTPIPEQNEIQNHANEEEF
ncbi:hypothetical protein RIF29_00661 [Crotalaria pallida]|uniref:Uncharacterized protein n=1 Tax=Crotalaria pallida TaxID=3830 RepID=A0AAN9P6M6_CROPI